MMPTPFHDKTGQSFGFWTVLEFAGRDKSKKTIWLCKCICGVQKKVVIGSLQKGRSKSCGCKQYQMAAKKNTKHGMASTPTYKSWHAMIQRCEGKGGHESYPERGIAICEQWYEFNNFLLDMGIRPKGKTLDRIDNTKGYSKENCRWATSVEQINNRSNTVFVIVNDERLALSDACKKYNVGISCARHRLKKGMSYNDTFTKPNHWRHHAL
jgi:hypothetical protein